MASDRRHGFIIRRTTIGLRYGMQICKSSLAGPTLCSHGLYESEEIYITVIQVSLDLMLLMWMSSTVVASDKCVAIRSP